MPGKKSNRRQIAKVENEERMRKKEKKIVITFYTTTDAMAMEKRCKEEGKPGRLIPVPGTISAGCGLAWCAIPKDRDQLLKVMEEGKLTPQAIHECML